MGPGAKIHKIPLPVEGNLLPLWQLSNQLALVRLVLHEGQRLVPGQGEALDGQRFLDDFLHLGLDGNQILGGEVVLAVEVIVKAAVDGGADGQLSPRPQPPHGLGHDVGGGMPIGLFPVLIVKGQDIHRAVLGQRGAQIHRLPVQLGGAGRPVEPHGDVAAERVDGRALRDLSDVSALAGNVQHVCSFLSVIWYSCLGTGALTDKKAPSPGSAARCRQGTGPKSLVVPP